jgi:hypothetical protein
MLLLIEEIERAVFGHRIVDLERHFGTYIRGVVEMAFKAQIRLSSSPMLSASSASESCSLSKQSAFYISD